MYTTGTTVNNYVNSIQKSKDYNTGRTKAISVQAWTGPEVSGRCEGPDFKTVGT
jgi:hypothetical protein